MGTSNGLPAQDAWWTLTLQGSLALGQGQGEPLILPEGLAVWPSGASPSAQRVRLLTWRVTFTELPVEVSGARR